MAGNLELAATSLNRKCPPPHADPSNILTWLQPKSMDLSQAPDSLPASKCPRGSLYGWRSRKLAGLTSPWITLLEWQAATIFRASYTTRAAARSENAPLSCGIGEQGSGSVTRLVYQPFAGVTER